MKVVRQCALIFRRLWRYWFDRRIYVEFVNDQLPKVIRPNVLYIVEEDGYAESASMICPCSCHEILYLNLIPDERPLWYLVGWPEGLAEIKPSVWRQKGCRSHFWLKRGRVYWCKDE